MTQSKFRIPRATTAALLLGGAACDVDSGGPGSPEGINTSDSRIRAVAKLYCEQYQECYEDDFDAEYADLDDCIDDVADNFRAEDNKLCTDAALDYISCTSQLSCRELDQGVPDCDEFVDAYREECGIGDTPTFSSSIKHRGVVRKYRIPR